MYMQQKDLTFYHIVSMNPLGFLKGSGINEVLNGWIEEQIEGMGMDGRLYSRLISSIMKMTSANLEQELRHMDIEPGEGRNEYFLRKLMLLTLWTGDYSTDDCTNFKKFVEEFLSRHEADQVGDKKNGRHSNSEPLRSKERYDEAFPALSFQTDGVSINTSLLTLNWANAVNSLTSLNEHPNLSLDHVSMKPIKRFSCSDVGRGMYRVLKQTELKSTNHHHYKNTNSRVGRPRFYRHKRNTGSNSHRNKLVSQSWYDEDEGRITDNEENYSYIEMVRCFQNWGLCEGVDEENPFPSVLFPMKDFTNDVNKKMKDENLLRMDEEGMKGIWMKMLNKTSGQSLANISDVSIGDDNILAPSPKLSWTNHFDSGFIKRNEDVFHQESNIFNDLIFQQFYAYERILFDLLTQNDAYNFPWNENYMGCDSFTKPNEPGMEVWNGGIKEEFNLKDEKFLDKEMMTSCFNKEESKFFQPIKPETEDFMSSNENLSENTQSYKDKELKLGKEGGTLFNELFQPCFSTPKYPKLNVASQMYQGVTMLGVENIDTSDTTNDSSQTRTLSSQKRSRVRVNLEKYFDMPTSDAGKGSGSESELDYMSNPCFEMFPFDDFENDADDECHSVSTIIFSDDDDSDEISSLFSSSLSSNCSNEKNQEIEGDWVKINNFDLNKSETENSGKLFPSAYSNEDGNVNNVVDVSFESFNDNCNLPHFCKALLRDSYYTIDTPQKDLNNNICMSLPIETTPKKNLLPPSFLTFSEINTGSPCMSQESPMNCWDRFIAIPTSTRQLITFSQSKLNSLVKDTSTQPQFNFKQKFPMLSTFGQLDDEQTSHNAEASAISNHNITFHKSQSSLIPMFTVDLSTTSSSHKLDINNNLFQHTSPHNSFSETSPPLQFSTSCHLRNTQTSHNDYNHFEKMHISSKDRVHHASLPLDLISNVNDAATDDLMLDKEEGGLVTSTDQDGLHVVGGIYPGECKDAGDSILEVVSDHLHKLRDEFEKGVRLFGEEWNEGGEKVVVEDSKDAFEVGWDLGEVMFNQIECQKDFAYEPPQVLFY